MEAINKHTWNKIIRASIIHDNLKARTYVGQHNNKVQLARTKTSTSTQETLVVFNQKNLRTEGTAED